MMKTQRGFTLIELVIIVSIVVILLGFITINLVGSQRAASLNSTEQILLADLKQQQLKSMIGDTEGRETADSYGVHFDSNKYILFHGATYSSTDDSNYTINLENSMQFNNANYDVVFLKRSGEIQTPAAIELQENNSSEIRRIHLNIFGVVTQIETL